jgi:hypothetical protein
MYCMVKGLLLLLAVPADVKAAVSRIRGKNDSS